MAPEQPDSEVAILEGYKRYYVLYYEQGDISAVDGKRSGGFAGSTSSVRLPPAEHWIEIMLERYVLGGGPYATCAFRFRFEARHSHQIKAHSLKAKVGLLAHPAEDPYRGLLTLSITTPEGQETSENVTAICATPYQILCTDNPDCGAGRYCDTKPGHEFGVCRWHKP